MSAVVGLVAGIAVTAALVTGVALLRRKLRILRTLGAALYLLAVAIGLVVYRAVGAGRRPDIDQFLLWLLLLFVSIAALRIAALYVFDVHLRTRGKAQLPPLLSTVILVVAYLAAGIVTLRTVYPTLDLAPLLATSAVTSLVLGLALQPILGNFFAGVVITLERPYRVNDWIKVGETEGRVVEITWRTTHLRTRDNDDLIIPNSKAADEYVLNYGYPHPLHMARIYVGADYRVPPYKVRAALLECVAGVDGIHDKPSPDVFVREFSESSIQYELRVWIDDMGEIDRVKSALRARIWESFRQHQIAIPFPIRTVELAPRPSRAGGDARSAPTARLFVSEGPGAGTTLPLGQGRFTIGRAASNDLVLADAQVSKEHAVVEWTADGFAVVDRDSSSGTRVNGVAAARCMLRPFDRITLGSTVLVFEDDAH